jgi:hypothetical protein
MGKGTAKQRETGVRLDSLIDVETALHLTFAFMDSRCGAGSARAVNKERRPRSIETSPIVQTETRFPVVLQFSFPSFPLKAVRRCRSQLPLQLQL